MKNLSNLLDCFWKTPTFRKTWEAISSSIVWFGHHNNANFLKNTY